MKDGTKIMPHRLGVLCQRGCLAILVALLISAAIPVASASAKQTHVLQGPFGNVAKPVFGSPNGLAVDPATNDLLVIDAASATVSRFNADGTSDDFSALGTNVIDAKGGGQCPVVAADCDQTPQSGFVFSAYAGEQQIAVDNSGTITDGNIYVTQQTPSGLLHLVDVFAGSGEYLGQLTGTGGALFGQTNRPCGVAVDSGGNVFVADYSEKKIYRFDPTVNPPVNSDLSATFTTAHKACNLAAGVGSSAGSLFVNTFFTFEKNSVLKLNAATGALEYVVDPDESRVISVDPVSGNIFSFREAGEVMEWDASGASPALLSSTSAGPAAGLAVEGSDLYIARGGAGAHPLDAYGPVVTVPNVTTGAATITGDTSATLEGIVDPEGVALEECKFEYGFTSEYGTTVPCTETIGEIGTSEKELHAAVAGLAPESLYHYRLVAQNPNDTIEGPDKIFRTPGKPTIPSLGSINVSSSAATLIAKINAENSPTTYHFEWGVDTGYGKSTPELEAGSGESEHPVQQTLGELDPGVTYHYRAVASNGIGVTESSDHTFTTYPVMSLNNEPCANDAFRVFLSAPLPDCRAYEMVSPIDKNGGDIKVLVNLRGFPTRLDQSSTDGDSLTYTAMPAFGDPSSAPLVSQYLATRGEGGWSSQSINPPRKSVSLMANFLRLDLQYKIFSPDLSDSWLFQDAEPALDECAPEGFINIYRRDATGSYEALVPSPPTNVTPSSDYRLEIQGVSADGSRTVFRANAKLTGDAASGNNYQLYEHIRGEECGQLRVVSMTTNGKASAESASVGTGFPSAGEYREGTVARAVSTDGSRVFFTLGNALYLRVNADREQSPVSAGKCIDPSKGCTLKVSPSAARFWTAAVDGSTAIYSAGEELFEYDVDKALAGEAASALIAKGAKGVVGTSEDATRIYFVSSDEIDGEGNTGKPNLYLYQPGQSGSERYRLVATLDPFDLVGFQYQGFSLAYPEPIRNGVRVTADGGRLAFVSTASLTGYDNSDAVDGRPALEVFLYDAGDGNLACISCNPSNAQPQGREFGPENDVIRYVSAMMAPGESQTFAPRSLSADGNRLFFESFESLLPRDINKTEDVYEWQRAASAAACQALGMELFVPASGGCLSLISSGQDETDSELADASPDGSDVFIRTASSLLPQDPGQVDVYDVREGGGLPIPPPPVDPCEDEACPGPVPTPPADTAIASQHPASGNPPRPKPCPKGKVRNKAGKCVKKKPNKKKSKGQKKKASNNKKGAKR